MVVSVAASVVVTVVSVVATVVGTVVSMGAAVVAGSVAAVVTDVVEAAAVDTSTDLRYPPFTYPMSSLKTILTQPFAQRVGRFSYVYRGTRFHRPGRRRYIDRF